MRAKSERSFVPQPEVLATLADVAGNAINGLGEDRRHRAAPILRHAII